MSRLLQALLVIAPMVFSGTARAEGYSRMTDRDAFVSLTTGRDLALPIFGVTLKIVASGQIEGNAMGGPVSGRWEWKDGLFCRSMTWSGTEIPTNCQTVEVADQARLRFTSDAGQGKSAIFVLR